MATHTKLGAKNAMDVNVANDISLEVKDIQIGAVEIKNHDTDDRAIVGVGSSAVVGDDALYVADANVKESIDSIKDTDGIKKITDNVNIGDISAGTQSNDVNVNIAASDITIGGDAEQTPDSVAAAKIIQQGGIAETTVPTAVADGDAVATWVNEYGQQVLYGANLSSNALDTNQVNQALLNTIEVTLLDAVTAGGSSSSVDVSNYNKLTFAIISSSTSDGATVALEGSLDDTNWYTIDSNIVDTDTTTSYVISDEKHKYVRATISSRTDGIYTVDMIGGN
jgi:hypothetical protein